MDDEDLPKNDQTDDGGPQPTFAPEPESLPSARERLRAVEDEWLGPDEFRLQGEVQKGHGSKFRGLTHEQHAHHAALERAVEAEKRLGKAREDVLEAERALAKAEADAEATQPPRGPDVIRAD